MARAEAAFILALGLHHGYWVNLRPRDGLAEALGTLQKDQVVKLLDPNGKLRKTLTVMDVNTQPLSLKVMDPDGDHPVGRGDTLVWGED